MGAGVVVEIGPGVTSVRPATVIALHPNAAGVSCLAKTNLCTAIRATQGKGLMPDGTSRFSYRGQTVHHYMGCSTFSNFTVLPEIAVAKIRTDAPFDKACYIGCGVTTGVGAVVNTAGVEPGANVVVFGLGGIGLNVIQGARLVGASMIVGVDINPPEDRAALRMTHFVNPKTLGECRATVKLTDGGPPAAPAHRVRPGAGACHRGWGRVIIGVAEAGKEIATRPLAGHRGLEGTAFWRARPTDVPTIVDWYMDGKIQIDPMITHTLPWTGSTRPSTSCTPGKHPQRGGLLK